MNRAIKIITAVLVVLLIGGGVYWYFFIYNPTVQVIVEPGNTTGNNGFNPLNKPNPTPQNTNTNNNATTTTNNASTTVAVTSKPLPVLRLLSAIPVGGYGIFTSTTTKTAKVGTTTMRWVDRGRGNVYETFGNNVTVSVLSNTLVPRIYQSWWNNSLSAFVAQYMSTTDDTVTTVIANILKNSVASSTNKMASTTSRTASTTTSTTQTVTETPYQLKGTLVSGNIIAVKESPNKDRVLIVAKQDNRTIGYTSNFDGTKQTQLFNIPLTQIIVDWPETNTVTITTKGSSFYAGYLYFVNVKTGVMKQVLGGLAGLSTKVSHDATKVFYSTTGTGSLPIDTAVLDLKTGIAKDVIFKTLAEKCVWSMKFVENIYCAVPSQLVSAIYPDDWYIGNVSLNDNIWLLNTKTGNSTQLANLLTLGNALIDVINPQLDNTDNYLLFMNKNDLSLWSLDLIGVK